MKEIGFSTLATRCAIKLEHDKQAKSVKDGESIVSIVLEIQEREDNEIPPHFIHEVKTKKG